MVHFLVVLAVRGKNIMHVQIRFPLIRGLFFQPFHDNVNDLFRCDQIWIFQIGDKTADQIILQLILGDVLSENTYVLDHPAILRFQKLNIRFGGHQIIGVFG